MDLLNAYNSDSDVDIDSKYDLAADDDNMIALTHTNNNQPEYDMTDIDINKIIQQQQAQLQNNTSNNEQQLSNNIGGHVAVVQVNVKPVDHDINHNNDNNDTVQVVFDVITRYVPHLGQKINILDNVIKQNNLIETDDEDSNNDDDIDNDNGFIMTGDINVDRANLLKLMNNGQDIDFSDTDDSDTSSDDDDSSDDDIDNNVELEHDYDSNDDIDIDNNYGIISKNEIPIDKLNIQPENIDIDGNENITYCGYIISYVNNLFIIQHDITSNSRTLSFDSVLCYSNKAVIGRIEDIIGNVNEPYYSIRPAGNHISQCNEQSNSRISVYYVNSMSSYALAEYIPGSDASNIHDEEVDINQQEYSDDEKEAQAKKQRNMKKRSHNQQQRNNNNNTNTNVTTAHKPVTIQHTQHNNNNTTVRPIQTQPQSRSQPQPQPLSYSVQQHQQPTTTILPTATLPSVNNTTSTIVHQQQYIPNYTQKYNPYAK